MIYCPADPLERLLHGVILPMLPTPSPWRAQRLPIHPLRAAILSDAKRYDDNLRPARVLYAGLTGLARDTQIAERQLYRWLEESSTVDLGAADTYCCRTGRHLDDLYPDDEYMDAA